MTSLQGYCFGDSEILSTLQIPEAQGTFVPRKREGKMTQRKRRTERHVPNISKKESKRRWRKMYFFGKPQCALSARNFRTSEIFFPVCTFTVGQKNKYLNPAGCARNIWDVLCCPPFLKNCCSFYLFFLPVGRIAWPSILFCCSENPFWAGCPTLLPTHHKSGRPRVLDPKAVFLTLMMLVGEPIGHSCPQRVFPTSYLRGKTWQLYSRMK